MIKQNTDGWIAHIEEAGIKNDCKRSSEKHNWKNIDKIKGLN